MKMTDADAMVEKGAQRLRELAQKAAARGGVAETLAEPLAEDADFLRKLKPSLVAARLRGEAPAEPEPGAAVVAPSRADAGTRPAMGREAGPNPFLVVGAALLLGVLLAKVIDWRGHAHPSR